MINKPIRKVSALRQVLYKLVTGNPLRFLSAPFYFPPTLYADF